MDSPGKPSRGDAPIFYAKVVINVALVLIASLYGWILGMFYHATGRDPTTISHAVSRVYDALNGRLLGLRVQVLSRSKLADTTPWAVVVCNHQSFVDVRCVAAVWRPKMVIMAKESLRYYPVLGWFMSWSGHIFIRRNDHESAVATLNMAAAEMTRKESSVLVFPEGTRGNGRQNGFLPFKKGAFHLAIQAKCPIIPVVFSDYTDVFSSDAKRFKAGTIYAKILDPISTDGFTALQVDGLISKTRDVMEAAYAEMQSKKDK